MEIDGSHMGLYGPLAEIFRKETWTARIWYQTRGAWILRLVIWLGEGEGEGAHQLISGSRNYVFRGLVLFEGIILLPFWDGLLLI